MQTKGVLSAAALTVALMSGAHRAHANDSVIFGGGPMKNLYVDLVFWGPNCTPGGPTNACFVQDPDPQNDDRQTVMRWVTNLANWFSGGIGADGSLPPVGMEPALHYYGPSGITPGMWVNDPMPIPSNYLQGSGTSQPDESLFTPIVTLAQNGTLGPGLDFSGNAANWPGLPVSSNRLTLVITKGTNNFCVSNHQLFGCEDATGYHDQMSGIPFGFVEFESGSGILSHEVIEAMADPLPTPGDWSGLGASGWGEDTSDFSSKEPADQCENASNGSPFAWITVDSLYSVGGVSTPWATCRLTIPEQHAPLAGTLEYGLGQQPLLVFYVDPNGHVQALEWEFAGQPLTIGPYDYGQPSATVKAVGKPAAVYSFSGGGEYVFVKGSDGAVWMRHNDTWTSLGGLIYGDPSATVWTRNGTTWIHVAALGLDDHLYVQGVYQGAPYGWGQVPSGSVLFVGSPNITSRQADTLDLFAVGEDGQMKQAEYNQSSGWGSVGSVNWVAGPNNTAFVDPPFVTTPAVAVLGANSLQVMGGYAPYLGDPGMYVATWKGSNSSPWLTWNRDVYPASWTTWVTPFIDAMPKNQSLFSLQGTPAIVSSGNGRVDAFATSRGGELWWFYSADGGTVWYSVKNGGSTVVTNTPGIPYQPSPPNVFPLVTSGVTGDPLAISRGPNEVEVFYRSQLGSLIHLTFNETNNTWTSEGVLAALTRGIVYDPPAPGGSATQCFAGGWWMHCCPTGYVMVGADVGGNVFKCAPLATPSGTPTGDSGTWRNNMHSCPYGSAMAGLRADHDVLACVPVTGSGVVNERIDWQTQDVQQPMHACDPGTPTAVMSGIDVASGQFNCATTAQIQ